MADWSSVVLTLISYGTGGVGAGCGLNDPVGFWPLDPLRT